MLTIYDDVDISQEEFEEWSKELFGGLFREGKRVFHIPTQRWGYIHWNGGRMEIIYDEK